MAALSRFVVSLMACAAPLALAWWGLGLTGGEWRSLLRQLREQDSRRQALDRHAAVLIPSLDEKQRVTRAVVAGRMTFAEAASRFGQLEARVAAADAHEAGLSRVSLTGDESLWANVLGWVRTGLASDRAAAARVVPRMEGEFRARFGHDAPGARGPD